jgi:hypothetical protein
MAVEVGTGRYIPGMGGVGAGGARAMMRLRDTTCSLWTQSLAGTVHLVSIARIEQ